MSWGSIRGGTSPNCEGSRALKRNLPKIKGFTLESVLFDKAFRNGCGPALCTAQCCAEGVYLSQGEHRAILDHADRIIRELDESQPHDVDNWFEPPQTDEDYPSGIRIGTRIYNNKCVFLDKRRLCVLQNVKPGGYDRKWGLKPFYCRIYPITIDHGTITFERAVEEETPCCSINSHYTETVAEVCREELTQVLGEDGYRDLLKLPNNRHGIKS